MVGTESEVWNEACEKLGVRILFVFAVSIIPDTFYKYLEHRVEVRYENKKGDEEEGENGDGDNLENTDSDIGKEGRHNKGEYHKGNGCQESPNIDE